MEKKISNTALVKTLASTEGIQELIFTIRGVQVMLDRDLARLYQVETRVLNQAVKRNINRFPERYMFQLTEEEAKMLLQSRSQFVTLNDDEKYFITIYDDKKLREARTSSICHLSLLNRGLLNSQPFCGRVWQLRFPSE